MSRALIVNNHSKVSCDCTQNWSHKLLYCKLFPRKLLGDKCSFKIYWDSVFQKHDIIADCEYDSLIEETAF